MLRRAAEDLSDDPGLRNWTSAFRYLYGSVLPQMPDDDSWGAGRCLPTADLRNSVPPERPEQDLLSERARRVCRWLGPVAWGTLLLGASLNLAMADEPGAKNATPPRQPGFSSTEKSVLRNPAQLRLLGLCPQILASARQEQIKDENMGRAQALASAALLSASHAVDCVPDTTLVYIPAGKYSMVVAATSLVGDAAPSLPATQPPTFGTT